MDTIIRNAFERTFNSPDKSIDNFDSASGVNQWEMERKKIEEEFNIDLHQAKILVIGVGGAGSNTISTLTEMGIEGAKTVAVNTDAKHLSVTKAHQKILIGKETTRGLGAGGYPGVGKKAAEESRKELKELLEGVDMVFITCGLGGGTGTGAAPVIAEIAKSMGAIVIGTATMPFKMEGTRIHKAEEGLMELRKAADTVIVIENQKLLKYCGDLSLKQAFAVADELISTMIKGITETITQPSLVNLDYADVKAIMHSGGVAAIGVGESDSTNRAKEAVERALSHPLLEMEISGANGAIIQIIGGDDLKLEEINEIGEAVYKRMNPEAQVIWGARILPEYAGKIHVITIITGVKSPYILGRSQETNYTASGKSISNDLGIPIVGSPQ
ncbi:MAG: cell division protein FtsZ [Candidatus Aenigmarchaeota archaeon]|nr:cell division protein FtsZ [Candidatus Aenigmarchaeota archaeon]